MTAQIIAISSLVFITFIMVGLGIYYLFSRKNVKKRHEYFAQLHQNLKVGQRVLFANGLYGTVKRIGENEVGIEISKGIIVNVSRFSITEILK